MSSELSAIEHRIAARVATYLQPGQTVNLGVGIPTLVADYLTDRQPIYVHSENGILGVGPTPLPDQTDPNLVNAGKLPISAVAGASFFSSATSFAMIRGGHLDVAILGALQVDANGRLANWALPGRPILGVGGAMDLLCGAATVIVATTHLTRDGSPKIVQTCQYPLTGERPVDLIVTERATFAVNERGLVLVECAPDTTYEWLSVNTGANFSTHSDRHVD